MTHEQFRNPQSALRIERWHFVGIGGAGMSALADALLDLGAQISGSDSAASETTRALEARGVRVAIGHDASNVGEATRVVVTAALAPDNPEAQAAQELGIPIVKRAQLLGELMDLRYGIAVAGTHGKTTTSAMIAWVLSRAGRDPSYMVGGTIRGLGPGGHWGAGRELVAEADEYDRSFLQLRPQVAIITNIESDHLEYYGSEEAIREAFEQFACNVREGGLLLLCAEDPDAMRLHDWLITREAGFRVQRYGFGPDAPWRAVNVTPNNQGGSDYVAVYDEDEVANISLVIPGAHNVLNSLAVLAACTELGMKPSDVARHLAEFLGAGRRFEVKGEASGVVVVDDYAHHPTEIKATLEAARQRYPGRPIVVVFQPHTYTRTRDFLDDFARVLSAADHSIITEIYASRERDTLGMSGKMLADRIYSQDFLAAGINTTQGATFAPTLDDAARTAHVMARLQYPGCVILTMGAGDVWKVGDAVLRELRQGNASMS